MRLGLQVFHFSIGLLLLGSPTAEAAGQGASSEGWVSLDPGKEEGASVRIWLSPDRTRMVEELSSYSVMSGNLHVATICRLENGRAAKEGCQSFWIEAAEGGSEPDAGPKFKKALLEGAFEVVPLQESTSRQRALKLIGFGGLKDVLVMIYLDPKKGPKTLIQRLSD